MSIRRLLAALLLALCAGLVPAHAAWAQEGTEEEVDPSGQEPGTAPGEGEEDHDISHAAEECIHVLEDGGEPDDCQEAPSPIRPETSELVWGGISFLVVLFLLSKFAYPALKKSMEERTNRIRDSLDDAERTKSEAQSILDDYQRQLADARNESNRIIEEARQTADSLRQDLMQRAEQEAAELRQRTQEEIRAAQERATADLRAQVAELSISLAEKVVERSLDRETNAALIDSFIDQVGARGNGG
jgi:F-type H+-transporting ATPase subunit b